MSTSTITTAAITTAANSIGTYTIGHASGYVYPTTMNTITGIAGATYSSVTAANPNISGQSLEVKGDANFTGEVTIKGKKLSEVLESIEERLAILHPNEKLEEKWENLRGLRKAYMELEAEIKEKEAMWAILKR
jgi:hypothetical protein